MKIPGWNFPEHMINVSIAYIEGRIARKITSDELQEIAQMWDWNYSDDQCVEMLQQGWSAEQFDDYIFNS